MNLRTIVSIIIDDFLLPIGMALIVSETLGRDRHIDLAVFYCMCEILGNIWKNRFTFLIKEVRVISAVVMVPMPAMAVLSIFFPDSMDFDNLGTIMANYFSYVLCSIILMVLKPAVHLFFFGPTSKIDHDD